MSRSIKQYGNHDRSEFCCPCCGQFGIAEETLKKLLLAEKLAGFDFTLLGSYRCFAFNKKSGKKDTSSHVVGNAFNIDCSETGSNGKRLDKRKSFKILNACMQAGFTRIGINTNNFYIHVDDDVKKRENLFFLFT